MRLEVRLSFRLVHAIKRVVLNKDTIEPVEESVLIVTDRSRLCHNLAILGNAELRQHYLDVLGARERLRLRLLLDLLSCALKALLGGVWGASTCLCLIVQTIKQLAEFLEVRSLEEGLILNKVLDLLPIVRLERLVLQLLQVTLIKLPILHVLRVVWLEELLELAPLQRVAQLQEAHRLLLDAFNTDSFQSLSELHAKAMRVVDFNERHLDVEVVGRLG
mmetsp:Transcript_15965/g.21673  ORF Transcript_15965/g.21673 Transcript_15965/m.21673 type:complete len:219 (+) Transcript_15965:982-1638(+)